jgi:16S rRNA (guanine(966)-N(2))-methyltransferase RsmD
MTLRLSGGRRLASPPGHQTRPTAARVRQAVMNLLAPELQRCHWLDLCCGSGVMACEALQRGAAVVVAVERDRRIAAVARSNLEAVAGGLASCRANGTAEAGRTEQEIQSKPAVHCAEAIAWLAGGPTAKGLDPFDLIYLDPPWPAGLHEPITAAVQAGRWLKPGGTLIWECPQRPLPRIPAGWHQRQWRTYGGSGVLLLAEGEKPDGR